MYDCSTMCVVVFLGVGGGLLRLFLGGVIDTFADYKNSSGMLVSEMGM